MENKKVSIILNVSQWNVVLSCLANGRFAEVAEIINLMNSQAKPQIENAAIDTKDGPEMDLYK